MNPACSVVVCTRRRPEALEHGLAAIADLDHPSFEVIVVDNSSGDRHTGEIAQAAGARLVLEPRIGLSRARNAGGRAARGAIVAYTDDDALVEPSWLTSHAAALDADPSLAATTGRILPTTIESEATGRLAAAARSDLGDVGFRVSRQTPDWFEISNFGGVGAGGNMAFRRRLFAEGFAFHEALGLGTRLLSEEHYAFFTIIRAGHAIAYLPDAVVRHDRPANEAKLRAFRMRGLRCTSAYVVMLLVEERGYRGATLRFAVGALRQRRRPWRHGDAGAPLEGRGERLLAALAGPSLYLANRISQGRTTED